MNNKQRIRIFGAVVLIMVLVELLLVLQPKRFTPPEVYSKATSTEFLFPMQTVEYFLQQTGTALFQAPNGTLTPTPTSW